MTELENKIKDYANNYYQGNELISDAEYDALVDQLKREQPDSVLLNDVVGTDIKGVSKKYKLPITMGTLAKCNTEAETISWWNKHAAKTDVVIQYKCDGCLDYNTILDTNLGKLPIGKIVEEKIKCNVKSFNFETKKIEMTPIDSFMINNNEFEWYEVELENGTKIIATENHKFYLPELGCFRELNKLKIGDELKFDNKF